MKTNLKDVLKGKVVIVGIGNPMRADDGFGPAVVKRLNGRIKALCIDAGSAPENYVGKIARENPDTVVIIDAVHLGLAPGKTKILNKLEIISSGFTTHDISPRIFIEFLEKQTKADIYMLGVQPKDISFGSEMSEEVEVALDGISRLIMKIDHA